MAFCGLILQMTELGKDMFNDFPESHGGKIVIQSPGQRGKRSKDPGNMAAQFWSPLFYTRGQQTCSIKCSVVKTFGSVGHTVSEATAHLCRSGVKAAVDGM